MKTKLLKQFDTYFNLPKENKKFGLDISGNDLIKKGFTLILLKNCDKYGVDFPDDETRIPACGYLIKDNIRITTWLYKDRYKPTKAQIWSFYSEELKNQKQFETFIQSLT